MFIARSCAPLRQALPASATIGFLKVDARPVKQALLAWVTKWIFLFTMHLESKVP